MRRFLTIFAALIFAGGCGLFDNTQQVKVGVNIPLSGVYETYGKRLLAGIQLKCDELNADGGIDGKIIKLVIRDNASTPLGTAEVAKTLATWDNVPVIIGAYSSINTFALRPEALEYKIPVITPTGTADVLTRNNDYIFRTSFSDSVQGKALGLYAYHRAGLRRLAILVDADEDGTQSRNLGFAAKHAFVSCGGTVPVYEGYYSRDASFTRQIDRILEANVDGVCLPPTFASDAARFIKEARMSGFHGVIFGGDSWDEEEIYQNCGPNPGKTFYFGMFAADYHRPDIQAFVSEIMKRTGRVPATCEAQGYDTMGIVAEALRQGEDRPAVQKALAETRNYPGVGGAISILPDRNTDKYIFVKEIVGNRDGNSAKLIAIISPYDVRKIYDVSN